MFVTHLGLRRADSQILSKEGEVVLVEVDVVGAVTGVLPTIVERFIRLLYCALLQDSLHNFFNLLLRTLVPLLLEQGSLSRLSLLESSSGPHVAWQLVLGGTKVRSVTMTQIS